MAKMSYKKRFHMFFEEIKANSEVVSDRYSKAYKIRKSDLEKIMVNYSDFINIDEFEEDMKPYRIGTHLAHYRIWNSSCENVELIIVEDEPEEIELTEDMVSNLHAFNNCGTFDIRINETAFSVKYDTRSKTIETTAPDSIRKAIEKWWFI